MPTVRLSSENMGDASESDYDSYVAFVADRIDAKCGFAVEVCTERFGGIVSQPVSGATDEQEQTISEALDALWVDWCDEGAPDHG